MTFSAYFTLFIVRVEAAALILIRLGHCHARCEAVMTSATA
jgi:hypothetical protein